MNQQPSLHDLVHRWQALQQQGQTVPVEELCADCPELLEELKRHLREVASVQALPQLSQETPDGSREPPSPDASVTECDAATASAPATERPRLMAGYEILGELGRGGMGVVLRVRDPDFGRTLAVKLMLPSAAGHAAAQQRFLEEARLTGRLQHPGIPPVHELGRLANGLPYFAMKLIEGQTLAALLKERRDPAHNLPRLIGIFRQVCQTLAYAHACGVIHRDLKPSNIMVGSFGEVQVMDWGLAKELARLAEEAPAQPAGKSTSPAGRSHPESPLSRTGDALGTPSYMAPEQARGEVRSLDERVDVFGLGAILCELLTGRGPYVRGDVPRVLRQAASADLAEAFARLSDCGADAELIELARQCLAARKEDRPRRAGEVAAAVERYEAAVQERLRRAELARAQAQVQAAEEHKRADVERARATAEQARADEESRRRQAEQARADEEHKRRRVEQSKAREKRKRRRVQQWLAVAVVLFVLAGGGVAVWYWGEQARRDLRQDYVRQQVADALDDAAGQLGGLQATLDDPGKIHVLLSDLNKWQTTLDTSEAVWKRARALADSDQALLAPETRARLEQLDQQLQAARQDFQVTTKLDKIRQDASALVEGKLNSAAAVRSYEKVFQQAGLALTGEAATVAARLRQSQLRFVWVAALDHWAETLQAKRRSPEEENLRVRLLAVARLADPDPWRDQVRDPRAEAQALLALAQHADRLRQSPQTLLLLAWRLPRAEAQILLHQVLVVYPQDFWLHFHLGNSVTEPDEKAGCFQAALATRPNSSGAHYGWGTALYDKKDYAGAIVHFTKALEFDPKLAQAHVGWGATLAAKEDNAGAIVHYTKALELDPKLAQAHGRWGAALAAKKDYEGAIIHYTKALELDPKYALAHHNWGIALKAKTDYDRAIVHYAKALELDPNDALAHNNWGIALKAKKDYDGAIVHYVKALELDPKLAQAHNNWGIALKAKKDYDGAIVHYTKALELDPKHAKAHYSWGNALYDKKDYAGAIVHYTKALELDPNDALAHGRWGAALAAKKDYAGAIVHCTKALELDPNDALAHHNWGFALAAKKDYDGAIVHYAKALELDPKLAVAHVALGLARLDLGDFAQAQQATQRALQLLPPGHPLRGFAQGQLKDCQHSLQLEHRAGLVLQGQAQPTNAAETLRLAQFCRQYRKHWAATRLYAAAFTAAPQLAGTISPPHRYQAASSAALAAAGQGRDAAGLPEEDKTQLRRQALDWLRADLVRDTASILPQPSGPGVQQEPKSLFQKLAQQSITTGPAEVVRALDQLANWQIDPALSSVRAAKELARLAPEEQKAWQNLWADVDQLLEQARSCFTEARLKGILTDQQKEHVHEVKLVAGKTYVFELTSQAFDAFLRLEDAQGKKLAENDDIEPGKNLNSRILFTPPQGGPYRLVATSFQQRGTGPYTLLIREYTGQKK